MRVLLLPAGALLLSATGWFLGPVWPLRATLELGGVPRVERPAAARPAATPLPHATLRLQPGQTRAVLPLPDASARLTGVRVHSTAALPGGLVLSSGQREGRWGTLETLAAGATTTPHAWLPASAYYPGPGDVLLVHALREPFAATTLTVTLTWKDD
jgi:hypothetical protein